MASSCLNTHNHVWSNAQAHANDALEGDVCVHGQPVAVNTAQVYVALRNQPQQDGRRWAHKAWRNAPKAVSGRGWGR